MFPLKVRGYGVARRAHVPRLSKPPGPRGLWYRFCVCEERGTVSGEAAGFEPLWVTPHGRFPPSQGAVTPKHGRASARVHAPLTWELLKGVERCTSRV